MGSKAYYVYIMTNEYNSVLYTGVTNDLCRRVYEHKHDLVDGFTKRYHLHKLVYYETTDDVTSAITREKQIKGGPRKQKVKLIIVLNPTWQDLSVDLRITKE